MKSPDASRLPLAALRPLAKSMVAASLREPRGGLYLIQDICWLPEPVDLARLQTAWRETARRHAALRARIDAERLESWTEDEPTYEWAEADWSGVAAADVEQAWARFLKDDRERGFAWSTGVAMRFTLIRLPASESVVVWTVHHALLDGRSLAIVWREWLAAYDGVDVAPQQSTAAAVESRDDAADYWRDYLQGLERTSGHVVSRLPVSGEAARDRAGAALEQSETLAAQDFARRHGITLHTLVQGAWALLLSRYSGRGEVIFGVTRTGRASGSPEVGMLINTLPLRVRVNEDQRVADWLTGLREEWDRQRPYAATPLDQACQWGQVPRGTAPFDSVLIYDHASPGEVARSWGGRWQTRRLRRHQRSDSGLVLSAYGEPTLAVEVISDRRLYHPLTTQPLAAQVVQLLRGLIAGEDRTLAEIEMLTEAERRWLVHEVNATTQLGPDRMAAHHLLEQQARQSPSAIALEWPGGTMSYAELNAQANRLATRLVDQGIRRGDLVGLQMPRSPRVVVAMLATLKAGAAFVSLRPDLPEARLAAMVEDASPRLILTEEDIDALSDGPAEEVRVAVEPGDRAYVVFTSGSTGRPKGVAVSHGALVNHTLAAVSAFGITEKDRRLQYASLGSDVLIAEVFNYLSSGATLVFSGEQGVTSVNEFFDTVRTSAITITGLPATWWNEWVAALELGAEIPQTLRAVVVGMERVQPASFAAWRRIAGSRVRWFNAYGPSETSPTSIVYEAGSSEWEGGEIVPIGKPLANMRAYVVDARGRWVPAGQVGELYLGGTSVGLGYINGSDDEAARFIDQWEHEQRVYRTGDLVYRLPDGHLVFVGRLDRQVKIRGFRVELEEIEAVLMAHPSVRQAAVVATGEDGRQRLAAYVVPQPASSAGVADWRNHCMRTLPEHMLPACFVTLQEMPLTSAGKIDRLALPKIDGSGGAISSAQRTAGPGLETALLLLWRQVLGQPDLGPDDSFFDAGGDSLAATRLVLLIHQQLGRDLPLATLMKAASPARMAALLTTKVSAVTPAEGALLRVKASGSRPPLICITTTIFGPVCFENLARELADDQPLLVLPMVEPEGGFAKAVDVLVEPALATILAEYPEGPYVLGGYCLGGIVAHAVAQRLAASGGVVRSVVLFDAPAPGYPKVLQSTPTYLKRLADVVTGRAKYRLRDVLSHARMLTKLAKRSVRRTYEPAPAGFPVVQFIARSEEITTRVLADPRLGWQDLCPAGFRVFTVGAGHGNLFDPTPVRELAALLEEVLGSTGAAEDVKSR